MKKIDFQTFQAKVINKDEDALRFGIERGISSKKIRETFRGFK